MCTRRTSVDAYKTYTYELSHNCIDVHICIVSVDVHTTYTYVHRSVDVYTMYIDLYMCTRCNCVTTIHMCSSVDVYKTYTYGINLHQSGDVYKTAREAAAAPHRQAHI